MRWVKKGLIFEPKGQFPWVVTHGMLPTLDQIDEDIYRIYFSGRDVKNVSRIGYVDININNPGEILKLSENPVLDIGELGCFDDNGVSPTFLINHDNKKYLYYLGWNPEGLVKTSEISGLAISNDNGETFHRYSRAPIIDRTNEEPFSILVISSIIIDDGGVWRMWYDSSDCWLDKDLPHYNIKYAVSLDGITWSRLGNISVDYKYKNESRVSRASVIKEEGIYKMWYCYAIGRGGYKMGYAESLGGYSFTRKDQKLGLNASKTGWDSEMVCYPQVIVHKGKKYMFYCGNSYGKTGFGYAVFE